MAAEEALRTGHKMADVDHLMLGLLRDRNNNACRTLADYGIDLEGMKFDIDSHIFKESPIFFDEAEAVHPTEAATEVLKISGYEAIKHGSKTINTSHFLLAISKYSECISSKYLSTHNIGYMLLKKAMEKKGMLNEIPDSLAHMKNEVIIALGEQLTNIISTPDIPS